MAYQFENDDHQEVIYGKAGVLVHYPKVPGTGPVAVVGTPTYEVFDGDGVSIGTGNMTVTATGDADLGNDRLTYTAPNSLELDEGYELHIDWVHGTSDYKSVVVFDVVRYPWRDARVGLGELRTVRADIDRTLLRLATKLTLAGTNEVKTEACASIMARQAKLEMAEFIGATADGLGVARPHLVIDRGKLGPSLAHLTAAHVYETVAKDPTDGDDPDSAQARWQRMRAMDRYKASGAVKYDTDEDGFGEDERELGHSRIKARRVQS